MISWLSTTASRQRKVLSLTIVGALIIIGGASWHYSPVSYAPPEEPVSSVDSSNHEDNTNTSVPDEETSEDKALNQLLLSYANAHSAEFGIAVMEIGGENRRASHQSDKQFISASTYKLFLLYSVLAAVESSDLSLSSTTSDGYRIDECVDMLITYSSEDCSWTVGQLVGGWQKIDQFIADSGFDNTSINNYSSTGSFLDDKLSTAADQATFMYRLQQGDLLNHDHTELLLNKMKGQKWRERIPAGVPDDIVVADKPGWIYEIENDTAIIYGHKTTFVLAIMSDGAKPQDLASISRLVFEHFEGS